MAEYIEREALLNRIATLIKRITPIEENRDMFYHDSGWNGATTGAKLEVMNAPAADVVEVVRCKDCIHWSVDCGTDETVCLKIYSDGAASAYAWQERKPDDFCSYGERKEG